MSDILEEGSVKSPEEWLEFEASPAHGISYCESFLHTAKGNKYHKLEPKPSKVMPCGSGICMSEPKVILPKHREETLASYLS